MIAVLSMLVQQSSPQKEQNQTPAVSTEVQNYQPILKKFAKQYGVEAHTDVLLSIMMQESGGRGDDPMQASESRCGKPGCIRNPEQSIQTGVLHFANMLQASEGDLKLAVQSYNFGSGFIAYAKQEAGGYTEAVALKFSQMMYAKTKDKVKYRCLRPEAKAENACYGDIYYVPAVMRYVPAFAE